MSMSMAMSIELNDEERTMLRTMVDQALRETRVEVHRTHHSPDFRSQVQHREDVLRGLLAKLKGV